MTNHTNVLDAAWERDFIVELRLRDVDGRTIGDALAQVRSHCAESGQPLGEAFGDPEAYARSLDLPMQPSSETGVVVARSVIGLIAMFLTLWGFMAWLDGEGLTLTVGRVLALLLLTAAVALIAGAMRSIVRHPGWSSIVMGALIASVVVAEIVLTHPLVVLPALAVAVLGAVTLVATSVWEFRASRSDDDPVIDPATGRGDDTGRAGRALLALTPWMLPIATAVLLLALVLMQQLA